MLTSLEFCIVVQYVHFFFSFIQILNYYCIVFIMYKDFNISYNVICNYCYCVLSFMYSSILYINIQSENKYLVNKYLQFLINRKEEQFLRSNIKRVYYGICTTFARHHQTNHTIKIKVTNKKKINPTKFFLKKA